MDHNTAIACLREIQSSWLNVGDDFRPPSVWIAAHAPVSEDCDDPQTAVCHAWYLNSQGIAPREPIDYVRFRTIHSGRWWCSSDLAPPASGVFNIGPHKTHNIGLAAFAEVQGADMLYLEYLWGGLLGRGGLYRCDAMLNRLECIENRWLA